MTTFKPITATLVARCLFHKYTTSSLEFFLGAPRSSVASGAGLEPGVPRGRHWRRTYEMDIYSDGKDIMAVIRHDHTQFTYDIAAWILTGVALVLILSLHLLPALLA